MKNKFVVGLAALAFFSMVSSKARADDGFSWFSIAPEIGYAYFFKTTIDEEYDVELPARNAMVLKGHVDIGGDGLALELAPLYEFESAGSPFGKFNALGGEITVVYRGAFGDVYPSLGAGLHCAGIIANDVIKSGVQLYARVPLGLTWYFADFLGLVVEAGVMYGGTGLRMKEQSGVSQEDAELTALSGTGDTYWGSGFAFDIMAGLRFP